jgi:hypothetical protein
MGIDSGKAQIFEGRRAQCRQDLLGCLGRVVRAALDVVEQAAQLGRRHRHGEAAVSGLGSLTLRPSTL